MTQSRFHLLQAPSDIRYLIYEAYVTRPGGLFYDYESGKLCDVNGAPVEMALARTCKLVASEMEGLAFRENTINFKTWRGDIQRGRDKAWRYGLQLLDNTRKLILKSARFSVASTSALGSVSSQFPLLRPAMEEYFTDCPTRFDIIRSPHNLELVRRAIVCTLKKASTAGDRFRDDALMTIKEAAADAEGSAHLLFHRRGPHHLLRKADVGRLDLFEIVHYEDRRWTVPTDEDIAELWAVFKTVPHPPREKWVGAGRVSAVYSAVRFLQALTGRGRSHVRQMYITEDRIGLHDGFGYGLLPYCIANPKLRITHRVPFWTTIYTKGSPLAPFNSTFGWLTGAVTLSVLGMPENVYSVFLDHEGNPEKVTQLFQQYVHREIACVIAFAEWEGTDTHLPENGGGVEQWAPMARLIKQTLIDISAGTSCIRCEFDCGEPMNVADILETIRKNPPTPSNPLRFKFYSHLREPRASHFTARLDDPSAPRDEHTSEIDEEEDRLEHDTVYPPPEIVDVEDSDSDS